MTLPSTFWGLVDDAVRRHGDRVLLEDESSRRVSFVEYRDACERTAAGLVDAGVGPGTVVSWMLPTTIDGVIVMGALARLGAVQNPLITSLGERELRFVTEQARTEVMLYRRLSRNGELDERVPPIADAVGFRAVAVDVLPSGDPSWLPPAPSPEPQRRWLYYTSGSTASPKGVWHSDSTVMHASSTSINATEPVVDDVNPTAFPIGHIGGAVKLAAALRVGHRMFLVEAWDPATTPFAMAEHGCTTLGTALPFFVAFLAAQRAHGDGPLWPRLRACISGGAPKPPGLHAEVKETLGGVGVLGSWGLTEFPVATSGALDDPDDMLDLTEGRPGPGVEVKVVGPDGEALGELEEGELCVRGPQRFLGYADPSLDAATIDDDGFVHTGDLGVVHTGGYVQITGRRKDVIIRNAENISAAEVEDCLRQHPAIADVAVVGVADPRTGERAVAVIELVDAHAAPTVEELAAHCRAAGLALWKAPEGLQVVDAIPRDGMGKVAKQQLRLRLSGR